MNKTRSGQGRSAEQITERDLTHDQLKRNENPAKIPRACHTRTHEMWAPETFLSTRTGQKPKTLKEEGDEGCAFITVILFLLRSYTTHNYPIIILIINWTIAIKILSFTGL